MPVISSVPRCAHWCVPPTCHQFWWITPDIFNHQEGETPLISQHCSPRPAANEELPRQLWKLFTFLKQLGLFKKRHFIFLFSHTENKNAFLFFRMHVDALFFSPGVSAFGTLFLEGSVRRRLSRLRVLRHFCNGESFQFLQERGRSIQVLQSSLWIYARSSGDPRRDSRLPARVFLTAEGGTPGSNRTLCSLDGSADTPNQPFLVAQVRLREDHSKHTLRKRSLRCGDDVSVCCKRDFYIRFKDIQWHDWIIAPEGYHMNYCMGQCPQHLSGSPGIASSFHATVFSQLKVNGINTAAASCCVPTERRPLSMVYFNSQHSIVKTDVPDMIVES